MLTLDSSSGGKEKLLLLFVNVYTGEWWAKF